MEDRYKLRKEYANNLFDEVDKILDYLADDKNRLCDVINNQLETCLVCLEKVKKMPAVKNQIVIADNIIVNKTDLISAAEKQSLEMEISNANPLAKIILTTYCKLDVDDLYTHKELFIEGKPVGAMKDVKTQVFRTPYTIKRKNLDYLIKTLDEDIYRLKGYLILDNNEAVMIQSVFGNTTLTPVDKTMHTTEIISLGKKTIDFEHILRKLIII